MHLHVLPFLLLSLLFHSVVVVLVEATTRSPLKTVIITGANSGVGFQATKLLAKSNEFNIIMACRNKEKAIIARDSIAIGKENVQVMQLDLADLNSVKSFSDSFKNQPIDCLVCNAGVQESTSGLGGKEANAAVLRTKQGFEVTVGTNHIGHFLLLKLLLDNVKKVEEGRIVILGSGVHDPESPGG
jgi:protochlorophyllide reductase